MEIIIRMADFRLCHFPFVYQTSLLQPQQKSVTITGDFKFMEIDDLGADLGGLPPEEEAKVKARVSAIQAYADMIDENFDAIKNMRNTSNSQLEPHYEQILTLNKSIETHFSGLVKVAKDNCLSPNEQVEMYKFILDLYRDQNRKLNEVRLIRDIKSAQKLQKYINSQTEKYLGEMSKL